MTLPTTRTTANTAAEHVADHNALHAEYNVPTHTHSGYEAAGSVTTHAAAADPHTGYVLESLIDAAGDLIVGTADNTVGRLAKGSALQVLQVNAGATALEWGTASGGGIAATLLDAKGDLIVASANDTAAKVAVGANGTVLTADSSQTAGVAWADPTLVVANRQTASYTLVLADSGKVVEMNVASGNNLTVPLNSSVAFAVGTVIELWQYGAGQTTVVATGGVTIRSSGGKLKLTGQYSGASLRKVGTDEWSLIGDITT